MNFLAHLYFSAPDEALIQGGFLGDFVKGPLRGDYIAPIEAGIRLHRHIDSFTDRHPQQKSIRQKLPSKFSRFSGIITDMMCDHFLSKHWADFSEDTLGQFNEQCMSTIQSGNNHLNEQAARVFGYMNEGEWLLKYTNIHYVAAALSRIGQRIRYANPLDESPDLLPAICDQIETDCLEILNDTRDAVTKWRAEYRVETHI